MLTWFIQDLILARYLVISCDMMHGTCMTLQGIFIRAHTHTHTAILFVISIIVFPAGMGVNPVQELCGPESGKFRLGDCSLGWAFILIIIGTLLALVAMVMSWTALKWRDKEDHDSFSI